MGGFSDFFLGPKDKFSSMSNLNPQQQQLQQLLTSLLGGSLGQGFGNLNNILSNDPEAFKAFERPAMRQFQEEILPTLAEGFGGLGASSSSGAQQTFARAGERLSENLQAQRSGLQQNALQQIFAALGIGLSPSQENIYQPGRAGVLHSFAEGAGKGIGILPFLL